MEFKVRAQLRFTNPFLRKRDLSRLQKPHGWDIPHQTFGGVTTVYKTSFMKSQTKIEAKENNS
jgi:hypothetical protein